MARFTSKTWKDSPDASTPLSAVALKDLEQRLSGYTDTREAGIVGAYRLLVPWRAGLVPQSTANGTYFLGEGSSAIVAAGVTASPLAVVYLDPADYAVPDLSTKYRVSAICLTNATAPATTLTLGLYPISATAGGTDAITMTANAVQSGSTVPFASPGSSLRSQATSGDFAPPPAGFYAIGVAISGSTAAGSREVIAACVQARNVPS